MNSFFSDAIASWNLLMEIFNYKDLVRPKSKSVFKIHDPAGLRNPFQLRESLSHILCYNFIDTPSGICHCKPRQRRYK